MKHLLTILLILTSFMIAVSQTSTVFEPTLIAPGEQAILSVSDQGDFVTVNGRNGIGVGTYIYPGMDRQVEANTASRHLFDNDEGIEFVYSDDNDWRSDEQDPYTVIVDYDNNNRDTYVRYPGVFHGIIEDESGAYLVLTEDYYSVEYTYVRLPGRTPEWVQKQLDRQASPGRVDTVYQLVTERIFTSDTVYLSETISRIDTVRELITERIFTSDTVYLQETITLEGDVDTVFVNRTFTTRDTVYNETTITQVSIDSVFLVGGQYAKDVVLAVDKALNSETLQAYPNPASDAVTISSEASDDVELKIYDTLGKVMESVPLSGGPHNTVINVADYGSGVYLYMLVGENGRSSTKRFIVD